LLTNWNQRAFNLIDTSLIPTKILIIVVFLNQKLNIFLSDKHKFVSNINFSLI
jgi:hypothetical protein